MPPTARIGQRGRRGSHPQAALRLEQAVPGAHRRLLPIVERHLDRVLACDRNDASLPQLRSATAEALCGGSLEARKSLRDTPG